jgi:hypothetical protein
MNIMNNIIEERRLKISVNIINVDIITLIYYHLLRL